MKYEITLPEEEQADLDGTAQLLAREILLFAAQRISVTASRAGMDPLAKAYLLAKTYDLMSQTAQNEI